MRLKDIDQHNEGGLRQKDEREERLLNDNGFVLSNLELSMTFP